MYAVMNDERVESICPQWKCKFKQMKAGENVSWNEAFSGKCYTHSTAALFGVPPLILLHAKLMLFIPVL